MVLPPDPPGIRLTQMVLRPFLLAVPLRACCPIRLAVDAIKFASTCRVPAAREFELLPLWFFVVELVASDSWLAEYSAGTDALHAFSKAVQSACALITGQASPSSKRAHPPQSVWPLKAFQA